MKKIYLFLIGMLCCFPVWAETVHVSSPGELKEALMDADFNGTQLKITGTLNGADLAAIHAAEGRLANVTELDLSEVSLMASDDCYASYGALESFSFYCSDTCKRDTSSYTNMLGQTVSHIKVYGNNLAGLFAENKTYQKVILPISLHKVGLGMCYKSHDMTIVLPSAIAGIEENAFYWSEVSAVTLPASCVEIGDYAFQNSKLVNINLDNVSKLGIRAFDHSKIQGDIKLGSLFEVPDYCFYGCNISSVTFQEGLKRIGAYAFRNTYLLKSLSLPEGLEYIGKLAFWNQYGGLQAMDIPKSLRYVGAHAIPEYSKFLELEDGVYYAGQVAYAYSSESSNRTNLRFRDGTIGISVNLSYSDYSPRESLVSLEIPSSVKIIGEVERDEYGYDDGAFQNYTNLESVILPEDLEVLGRSTFRGCKSLKAVNIPNGLHTIAESTFAECESLKDVSFPQSLRCIGLGAFSGTGLVNVTIGENMEAVGYDAFEACKNLLSMRIDAPDLRNMDLRCPSVEKIVFGPKVSYIDYIGFGGFMSGQSSLYKVIFEEDENAADSLVIGSSAFLGCSNMKISSLPKRLKNIGYRAFENCSKLELPSLPQQLQEIGYNAFKGCSNLRLPSLPESLKEIGSYAFDGIQEITSVHLGQDVTLIGGNAFSNVENIGEVYYDVPSLSQWFDYSSGCFYNSGVKKVVVGTHVEEIPEYMFQENSKLESVVCESRKGISDVRGLYFKKGCFYQSNVSTLIMPEYDDHIPEGIELRMKTAFYGNQIKELKMPDNIPTYLDGFSFDSCPLEKLYLGSNTKSIGQHEFMDTKLKWVDVPSSVTKIDRSDTFSADYIIIHAPFGYAYGDFKNNIVCPMALKKYASGEIDKSVARVIGYDIELTEQNLTMKAGETKQLHATIKLEEELPDVPDFKFVWESSNPDIAVVDENGVVTALKDGQAQIAVEASYPSAGYGKTCIIETVSTGIDNILSNESGINVETRHGKILVSGAKDDSKVSIYSLGGQCVRTTKEKSISGLASGIYVVTVENQKLKVILP